MKTIAAIFLLYLFLLRDTGMEIRPWDGRLQSTRAISGPGYNLAGPYMG